MAIVAHLFIEAAGSEEHGRLQHAIEAEIVARGGPPEGLMAHLGHPSGDGFRVIEAWRTEEQFRSFLRDVISPALDASGLTAAEPEVVPAWSIAIP
jgi:hypothetical protein